MRPRCVELARALKKAAQSRRPFHCHAVSRYDIIPPLLVVKISSAPEACSENSQFLKFPYFGTFPYC